MGEPDPVKFLVIHLGSRIATAEGRLEDGRGQLCAHGVTTCSVFPVR